MDEKIAQVVTDAYTRLLKSVSGSKLPQNDRFWTVVAGVVAVRHSSAGADFELLTLTTGTKCVGYSMVDHDGWVVRDCHAEVLARRALRRYMIAELSGRSTPGEDKKPGPFGGHGLFTAGEGSPHQFMVHRDVTLHLYVSEPPCGDASVTLTSPGQCGGEWSGSKTLPWAVRRLTGAESLPDVECHDGTLISKSVLAGLQLTLTTKEAVTCEDAVSWQVPSIARTKPVRSDIPSTHMTASMSCSDKLLKWAHVGVQGAQLSALLTAPIRFTSIVIGANTHVVSDSVVSAAQRGLWSRCPPSEASPCRISCLPTLTPFSERAVSGALAAAVPCDIPREREDTPAASKRSKTAPSSAIPCPVSIVHVPALGILEVLSQGRLQGATKTTPLHKTASCLCSRLLWQSLAPLLKGVAPSTVSDAVDRCDRKSLAALHYTRVDAFLTKFCSEIPTCWLRPVEHVP